MKTITDRNIFKNDVTICGKITCDYKCDSQCKRTLNYKKYFLSSSLRVLSIGNYYLTVESIIDW